VDCVQVGCVTRLKVTCHRVNDDLGQVGSKVSVQDQINPTALSHL